MQRFDSQKFIRNQVEQIKSLVGEQRTLVAISGGVDSTTSAVLVYKAIGENLVCVLLDDAFMRLGEPQHISKLLSEPPLRLPTKVLDVQQRFLKSMEGLRDAEEKRKAFRETFYRVLGETAENEKCRILIQGTIKADVDETTGGVKTQHNVLEQMGIDPMEHYGFKIVEPLITLYKWQVRMVARDLGIPSEIADRQPFPGPGLSVRVLGKITVDKLEAEKRATVIVEESFVKHNPSQYFAAILDNKTVPHSDTEIKKTAARILELPEEQILVKVYEEKATGIKGGKRLYGSILALDVLTTGMEVYNPPMSKLDILQAEILRENPSFSRMVYNVGTREGEQPYDIILRAIETQDYLTAQVSHIPWQTLNATANKLLAEVSNISSVYYDVTPKPPSTIEME